MKRVNEKLTAGNLLCSAAPLRKPDERDLGFSPAFLDAPTMRMYPRPLPRMQELPGRALVAGFERGGFFYTQRAAARACEEWGHAR